MERRAWIVGDFPRSTVYDPRSILVHMIRAGRRIVSRGLTIGLALGMLGCSRPASQERPAEILVAAAANLTGSFTELARLFTAQTGVRVTFSFGATGDLSSQIANGAPYDLFAAADVEHVDRLKLKGLLLPETCARYARGRLVLWSPRQGIVARIEDIVRLKKIGIANPEIAPYGKASEESLNALGLWREVQPKLVYGNDVSQTRQYAATGNVDAAFVPLSLVIGAGGHYLEVDERLHRPIDQALGVVKASQQPDLARRFAAFVLSAPGQAVLRRYGYAALAGAAI